MAKNNTKKGRKNQQKKVAKESAVVEKKKGGDDDKITWDDIDAMSDSEDEGGVDNELNTKAKNLRQAITNNLNGLLTSLKKNDGEDEEFEEHDLDGSSTEGDEDGDKGQQDEPEEDEEMEEEDDGDNDAENTKSFIDQIANKNDEEEVEDEDSDDGNEGNIVNQGGNNKKLEKYSLLENNNNMNSKALSVVAAELTAVHSKLPWAETFVIVPPTPLPFGEQGDPESNPLDIHDDLKREVAFYNTALEAVNLARSKCQEADIPFTRPEDFFAEMVKTDDHMANVKDRLIFENKKMEAVSQRKSNKEQKLRAKESMSNRLAEKVKRKKDHFQEVEDWANTAARSRGGALREDMDDHFLNKRHDGSGPGKKRQTADKKFGFGGKNGRFKQNDRKSMNDTSGFNPRGNFAEGMKKSNKKDGSGAGASRNGKRARDAKRSRK